MGKIKTAPEGAVEGGLCIKYGPGPCGTGADSY
jgi:hypothetical protein